MPHHDDDLPSKELGRRLFTAIATPLVLLVVIGAILGIQILRMSDDARWLDHSDEVIAKANELKTSVIDQETSVRGFMLLEDPAMLEPYRRAAPDRAFAELRALVIDNGAQIARLDEVRHRYDVWLASTAPIAQGHSAEARTPDRIRERKGFMDDLRSALQALLDAELTLRHARDQASASSVATAKVMFLALFAFAGIGLSFFSRRQLGAIAGTYDLALRGERDAREVMENEAWVRAGQTKLVDRMQGDLSIGDLGDRILGMLAPYVGAEVGAFFARDGVMWKRRASHALDARAAGPETFARGEGLVGKALAAREKIHVKEVPPDYLRVRSGTGETSPAELIVVPASVDDEAQAAIELAFLAPPSPRVIELLDRVAEPIAVAVRSAEYKQRLRELLAESQAQSEELQTQQEELQVANEELAEQSRALTEAQAQIEHRQEELESTNTQLEEQTNMLQRTQHDVEEKAAEVARESRYKSEFLANMSHELRTPLNSSLILAKLLADNKQGNLDDEQIKYAKTIYSAGNDLLALINDILDLSKIEAGKVEVHAAPVPISRIAEGLSRTFEPVARDRHLTFAIHIEDRVPESIDTDAQRVDQIMKNLLSNALKFTERGGVDVRIGADEHNVRFAVRDTGIGIAAPQQGAIFEAFRQADGTTSRKYGGTGLGLSISRDLARLLGGDIELASEIGRGSTFTLVVPRRFAGARVAAPARIASPVPPPVRPASSRPAPRHPGAVADDRARIDGTARIVLVIEDDVRFAQILHDVAHELAFKCLVAHEGEEGYALALEHAPAAILLDVNLPDRSGLSILDRLKHEPRTRHIPVHMISVADHAQAARAMGAVGYMQKPVNRDELAKAFEAIEKRLTRRVQRLLIVEDDAVQRDALEKLLGGKDVETVAVATVKEALDALRGGTFDCAVTDLALPDASGFELLERIASDDAYAFPPIIVYTGRSLTDDEEQRLRKYSSSIIVKGARSPERLLDEVTLFLHQVESELPAERQRMLRQARDREALFDGRKILIVEDDVRNIFALSSILEPKGAKLSIARNGREALTALDKDDGIDLVLMDIMMPEMDGLEAMRALRKIPRLAKLPVIALTAKAMKDDQDRCIAAGANDYITKPIDVEMLLSLLRVWMPA